MSRETVHVMIEELKRVERGQPVSAIQWNRIITGLERIAAALNMGQAGLLPLSGQVVELDGNLTGYEQEQNASVVLANKNESTGTDPWVDTSKNIKVTEQQNGCWLAGERHIAFREFASGFNFLVPGVQLHTCKLNATLNEGSTAGASVWELNPSGVWQDSGEDIVVYDWLLATGQSIASGKKIIAAQLLASRVFIVIAAQCP